MSFFGNIIKGNSGGNSGVTVRPSTFAVNNINERDSLVASNGAICLVQDASSDPTVTEGFAVYQKLGERWIKISDENIIKMQTPSIDSIQETNEKQFVTLEEKVLIRESVFIHKGEEPINKSKLWLDN